MHSALVVVMLVGGLGLAGCGKKKDEGAAAPGSAAPTAAQPTPAGPPAAAAAPPAASGADPWKSEGSAAPPATPPAVADDPDTDEAPTPAAPAASDRASLIAQICQRDEACGCPNENCEENFAKITTIPTSVWACIAQQPCEDLCAPKSGAPGTTLYKTCLEGKLPGAAPSRGGGGVTKSCRATSDCPGSHECCSGYCYEMGTSLWITACQMPSGKF